MPVMRNPVTLLRDPLRPASPGVDRELGDTFGADFAGDVDQDVRVGMPAVPAVRDLDRPDGADDADLIFDAAPRPTRDERAEPVRDDRQERGQAHAEAGARPQAGVVGERRHDHAHEFTAHAPGGPARRYLVRPAIADLGTTDRARPDRAARLKAREVGDSGWGGGCTRPT